MAKFLKNAISLRTKDYSAVDRQTVNTAKILLGAGHPRLLFNAIQPIFQVLYLSHEFIEFTYEYG